MKTSTLQLIGWDDALCRPIYRRCFAPTVAPKKQRAQKKSAVRLTLTGSPSLLSNQPTTPDEFKSVLSRMGRVEKCEIYDKHEEEVIEKPASRRTKRATVERGKKYEHSIPGSTSPESNEMSEQLSSQSSVADIIFDHGSSTSISDGAAATNSVIADGGAIHLVDGGESNASKTLDQLPKSTDLCSIIEDTEDRCDQPSDIQITGSPSATYYSDSISISSRHNVDEAIQKNDVRLNIDRAENLERQLNHTETSSLSCKRNDEQRSQLSNDDVKDVSSLTTTPIKQVMPRHISQPTCNYSNSFSIANGGSACPSANENRPIIQSPMIFECNRNDSDTDNISLFDGLDTEGTSCEFAYNIRSYGQSNKPNWTTKKTTEDKMNNLNAGQMKLVGWDDIKCRPIYRCPDQTSNLQKKELLDQDDSSEFVECDSKLERSQKKRVYSSSFRKSDAFKAARHHMDFDSPAAHRVTMEKEDVNIDEPSTRLCKEDNGILDLAFELEPGTTEYRDSSQSESSEAKIVSTIQPTSKSSIQSARAFFQYLDSNHHLTIAKKEDESRTTSSNVIRTTRKIMHSHELKKEYDEYFHTVSTTGIDPISIDHFARHWNLYFTQTGIIRDSLLDED